jgi:hypothetical protein
VSGESRRSGLPACRRGRRWSTADRDLGSREYLGMAQARFRVRSVDNPAARLRTNRAVPCGKWLPYTGSWALVAIHLTIHFGASGRLCTSAVAASEVQNRGSDLLKR